MQNPIGEKWQKELKIPLKIKILAKTLQNVKFQYFRSLKEGTELGIIQRGRHRAASLSVVVSRPDLHEDQITSVGGILALSPKAVTRPSSEYSQLALRRASTLFVPAALKPEPSEVCIQLRAQRHT